MTKIFISYSRVDTDAMKQFAELLGYGCDVWYDQSPKGIMGGEDWWQRITNEIEDCNHFIYLLSRDSVESEYCQKELDYALELEKHIIPVRIRARTKLPKNLSSIQAIDAYNDKLTDGIGRLFGSMFKNTDTLFSKTMSDEHHKADLRLITQFWNLLPSWYFSIQLESELSRGYIQIEQYRQRLHTFSHKIEQPEFRFNSQEVNILFEKFVAELNEFNTETSIHFTTDGDGGFESNYHYIMSDKSQKISPYNPTEREKRIITQKKVGFEKTIELYTKSKKTYLEIIEHIRLHYPSFTFPDLNNA